MSDLDELAAAAGTQPTYVPVRYAADSDRYWQVYDQGQYFGPYTTAEINHYYASGLLSPAALFMRPGLSGWMPWSRIFGATWSADVDSTAIEPIETVQHVLSGLNPAAQVVSLTVNVHQGSSRLSAAGTYGLTYAFGFGGAILLLIAFFVPVVSLPIIGGINYSTLIQRQFENHTLNAFGTAGLLVIATALLSGLLLMLRQFGGLWVTGIIAIVAAIITYTSFNSMHSDMRRQMERDLADNPFAGLATLAIESVKLQAALPCVLVSAVLLFVAAGTAAKGRGHGRQLMRRRY